MRLRKFFILIITIIFFAGCANSADVWVNDLKNLFSDNSAIIYEINMRTFSAIDTNKDGIIDFDDGEESGNFLNAISRLDELAQKRINTIHILPITPTGKIKALGTAGSLYAASSFNTLNPQLASKHTALSLKSQAAKFINEAHKRNIRVIVDLPSCGSYDLYLKRPELFIKDKSGQPIVPADWTDVRLLNAGDETAVNSDVYNLYKDFVDMVMDIGADGIRADVAPLKPAKFWKELIDYSRLKDPQFLWLAEAYEDLSPISEYVKLTSADKLLEAGFDGYYGGFSGLKDFKSGSQLTDLMQTTIYKLSQYNSPKSVIGSFTTHDEMSPILINGSKLSEMIIWLNATLPINSYFVDGFDTGDNYIYLWANKEAFKTFTDDDIYFVHRGKLDIFNFSRKPGGSNDNLMNSFILANGLKLQIMPTLKNSKFVPLKSSNSSIFAYAVTSKDSTIVVIGNLNFRNDLQTFVQIPKFSTDNMVIPININSIPIAKKGGFDVNMKAGETIVLMISNFEIK